MLDLLLEIFALWLEITFFALILWMLIGIPLYVMKEQWYGLKGLLKCALIAVVLSCSTYPDGIPPEHEEVIRTEWKIAQQKLEKAGVERTHLAIPEICTWRPKHGKIKTSASPSGWANGLFKPMTFTIVWNVETPHVIRHEAGHAILHFLDYDCAPCYEHDCGPCP